MKSRHNGLMNEAQTTKKYSTGRAYYRPVVVTYYHGTCSVYGPTKDGIGESVEYTECKHNHTTPSAAEQCGERLASKRAAWLNS